MEAVIQIAEVNSKDVSTPNGKTPTATVYTIKSEDGKEFSTFKRPLGQEAGKLRGQWATVEYQEVQKGKYINLYLDGIKPAEGLTEAPEATSVITGEAVKLTGNGVSHNITPKTKNGEFRTPEQILREGALKAAVDTAVGLQMADVTVLQIIEIARSYERWVSDGEKTMVADIAPFEETNLNSGETGDIVAKDGSLVQF